MINVKKIFAGNLRRIRKKLGLSQEEFGEAISLQYRSVSNLERANSFIKPENLDVICNTFNILPSEFFLYHSDDITPTNAEKIKMIQENLMALDEEKLDYTLSFVRAISNK